MIISVTERGVFRRCRRQWDYSSFSRQGLTPLVPPTALSFGTLIHKCHEMWLLSPTTPVKDIVVAASAQGLAELEERYTKFVGVPPVQEELVAYYDQVALALEMMTNYESRWGSPLPDGYTLVQPEQTLIVPIPGTEHTCPSCAGKGYVRRLDQELFEKLQRMEVVTATEVEAHSTTEPCPSEQCTGGIELHYLEGTLDALLRDEGGRLWIKENKTFDQHPKIDTLQMNDQFLAYEWILNQLDMGEVAGLLYDGMWKRPLQGARATRTLDQLFTREFIIHSPGEVANFSLQLRDEALDMASPDLRIYPNRAFMGCWDCRFNDLCTAQSRDEDFDYVRAKRYVSRDKNEWQEDSIEE